MLCHQTAQQIFIETFDIRCIFFVCVYSSFVLFAEHEEAEGGRGCSGQHEAADVGALSLRHPVQNAGAA